MEEKVKRITDIFSATPDAHEVEDASTNGVAADWPVFYSGYLDNETKFSEILEHEFVAEKLAEGLKTMDEKYMSMRNLDKTWVEYYAERIVRKYRM